MKKFDYLEVCILNMGIQEEIEKDVRMHPAMQHETLKMWMRYCELSTFEFLSTHQEVEMESLIHALKKAYVFWDLYFTCGEEAAMEALERVREEELKRNEEKHEKIMNKLIGEIEALIKKMD